MATQDRDFDIIGFLMTGDKIREDFWESKEFYIEELGRGICPYKDLNMLIESEFIIKINPRKLPEEEVEKLPEKWQTHIRWHLKEEFAEGQVEMEREIEEREKDIEKESTDVTPFDKPDHFANRGATYEEMKSSGEKKEYHYKTHDEDSEADPQVLDFLGNVTEKESDVEDKYKGAKVTPFNPNFEGEYYRDEDLMHKESMSQTDPEEYEIDEEKVKEKVEKTKQASVELSMVEESDPKDIVREKIQRLQEEMDGLGMFDRSRKKELKKEIEELEKQL